MDLMSDFELDGILAFLRSAERLKDTLRSSHTSSGRPESVAEHTWRLCLMALALWHEFPWGRFSQLFRICLMALALRNEFPEGASSTLTRICSVHDLGEAVTGDVPAIDQDPPPPKTA